MPTPSPLPPRPGTPPPLTATHPAAVASSKRATGRKPAAGNKAGGKSGGRAPFIRLLPVLILVAALMLSFRINDLRYFFVGNSSISLGANSLQAQQPQDRSQSPTEAAQPATPAEAPVNGNGNAAAAPPPIPGGTGDMSQSEKDLLNRLQERRLSLDARESALDRREALLKAGEDQIERKVTEMRTLQSTIQGLLRQYNEQEDAKMRSLVKIYENMKPKDAARIFEQLDMAILLEVVERMKEQKVAPILAEMDPSKARLLTSELAQRRQIPLPKGDFSG